MIARIYEARSPLTVGSESRIVAACRRDTGAPVALKLLKAPPTLDLLDRLEREVELSRRLNHPGLVHLLDSGMYEGQACQVMEWVEGRPLNRVLKDGPLPPQHCLTVLRALAATLARLHEAGVVHRDVKPANIVLRPDFSPVLLDLGAAALSPEEMAPGTDMVGCPSTMAPEILADLPADGRADIYSLGVVAQRMLGDQPSALATVIAACLATDPLFRPTAWRVERMLEQHR